MCDAMNRNVFTVILGGSSTSSSSSGSLSGGLVSKGVSIADGTPILGKIRV